MCPTRHACRPLTKSSMRFARPPRPHHRRDGDGTMRGTMMDFPLTLQLIFERGTRLFPDREIVTGGTTGAHRYTYRQFGERVNRLASALTELGLQPGDRVATF